MNLQFFGQMAAVTRWLRTNSALALVEGLKVKFYNKKTGPFPTQITATLDEDLSYKLRSNFQNKRGKGDPHSPSSWA